MLTITPRPLALECEECPAVVADDDIDSIITDAAGLIERVLCARCRVRMGPLEWAPHATPEPAR